MTKILSLLYVMVVLLFEHTICWSHSDQGWEYAVRYLAWSTLEEERAGIGKVKTLEINTRTGEAKLVNDSFGEKIRMIWCDEWGSLPPGSFYNSIVPKNLTSLAQIRALVTWGGDHAVATTTAKVACCFPESGIKGLDCYAWMPPKSGGASEEIAHFFSLCSQDSSNLVYVDGEPLLSGVTQNGSKPSGNEPTFDHEGKYFYYTMHGLPKRFNLETHEVDTIPGGDVPLIPWNQQGIMVYSRTEHRVKLLNPMDEVRASIDWCFEGDIHTVYAVDTATYLVGVKRWYSEPGSFGIDSDFVMAIYELDFSQKRVRMLVEKVGLGGQILSARRIE